MKIDEFVIPYYGFGEINFSQSFSEVKKFLTERKLHFTTEHWSNKNCKPKVAWDIIRMQSGISIFFAKTKMFKMYFEEDFHGKLDNGIELGMSISEAKMIDATLVFDEEGECYSSSSGYWLEESLISGKIETITIFIPQILDDEEFFSYSWCDDHKNLKRKR